MARLVSSLAVALAGSVLFAAATVATQAQEFGVGINGGASIGFGGSSTTSAAANAAIGSADADADATIGGGGVDGSATASIGGSGAANAGASATVGGGGAGLGLGIGGGSGIGAPGGVPLTPGTSGSGVPAAGLAARATNDTDAARLSVAGMSATELARFARRCADILANPGAYDRDLVGLCGAVRSAAR